MGELWRSQPMQLVQLYIQTEAAHDTVDELGQLGLVQFRDLNPHVNAFQRNFVNEVKRADEMERKLRYFDAQIKQANEEALAENMREIKIDERKDDDVQRIHMDELESKFEELEKQCQQMNTHQEALNRNYNQLVELKYVLEKDDDFFAEAQKDLDGGPAQPINQDEEGLIEEGKGGTSGKLGFISGVIDRTTFNTFERIMYRATRGNLYMKYAEITEDIKDPHTGQMTKKNVFCIFFPGQQLQLKIKKICESFSANLYPCPDTPAERRSLLGQVNTRLEDLKILLDRGWDQRCQVLGHIALQLRFWQGKVKKEKAIYHTMNLFNYDHGRKCLIAEGWCPKNAIERVQLALRAAKEKSGAIVPSILNKISSTEEPPTYFKTNKFTSPFQSIVDSYGIARYQEVNPAVLTIMSFPFQFGCMFGDLGHGFLLLLFALFLIRKEKDWEGKKISEMFEITYGGRYVLLLMALFAMYMGALYNELFALPMDFGSNYIIQIGPSYTNETFAIRNYGHPYAFGVDPVWKGASNELMYYNSLKMKMSIIIGVLQMSAGIVLHLLNGIHFRKWLDVFFEFIPRFLFLQSIFGYLCVLIVIKWNIPYMTRDTYNYDNDLNENQTVGDHAGTQQAPVLLNELIYMFLPGGPTTNPLFPGQYTLQTILVLIALISVPWMMLPKPLIMRYQNNQKETYIEVHHHVDDEEASDHPKVAEEKVKAPHSGSHGHGEEFDFGELMVHQILETIEFVLGSVSHTASYLRLWALSLAHSELATVFWDKIFFQLIELTAHMNFFITALGVFAAYSAWFAATLMVLMFMESLSAFLHALRLHWVEFQSKFYKGDGHAFLPFSYQRILSGEDEVASA